MNKSTQSSSTMGNFVTDQQDRRYLLGIGLFNGQFWWRCPRSPVCIQDFYIHYIQSLIPLRYSV